MKSESEREYLDVCGRAMKPGDTIVYAISRGRRTMLRVGKIVGLSEECRLLVSASRVNGKPGIVTIRYPDRCAILEELVP